MSGGRSFILFDVVALSPVELSSSFLQWSVEGVALLLGDLCVRVPVVKSFLPVLRVWASTRGGDMCVLSRPSISLVVGGNFDSRSTGRHSD